MKITLVARSFDPTRGGQEKYLHRLTECFLEESHEISVISERFGDSTPDHVNLHYHKVTPIKPVPGLRRCWFNWRARNIARRIDSDFVFSTGKVSFGDVYRAGDGVHQTYLDQCVPKLYHYKPKNLVQTHLQKKLFEGNPNLRIIVNSRMVREDILKRYDVSAERIEVIYNGVDTETFNWETLTPRRSKLRSELGLSDGDFACLFTAGGWKRKGLPTVLEAFKKLTDQSFKLFVAGHTKENRLRRQIEEHNLKSQVSYEGYVENIEDYYAACDALVFPSRYDAGASVVPEALASGLPVITSRWNGTHELVDEGENGHVLRDLENSSELIDFIKNLREADQPELRENAWKKGRQFTMEQHYQKMLDSLGD